VAGVDSEVFEQAAYCIYGQTRDRQIQGRCGDGNIVVVVVPEQNLDLSVFASGDGIDIWQCPHTLANNFLRRQGSGAG